MAWPYDDWRYGHPDWTFVSGDGWGQFVRRVERKRRRKPRAIRFAEVKVGDVLVQRDRLQYTSETVKPTIVPTANTNAELVEHRATSWAVVTDLWLDPVAGECDEVAGQMVGLRTLRHGVEVGNKWSTTRRGLASQQWHYATEVEIADLAKRRRAVEAIRSGDAAPMVRPKRRPEPQRIRPL